MALWNIPCGRSTRRNEIMLNPFGMGNVRGGVGQQGSNQPYNFKGLESRLGKIETGIAGLTDQFKNFQVPGQQTVDPVYTGGTEPNPLAPATPTGGIQSLPEAQEQDTVPPPTGGIQSLPQAQNTGFNFDPSGGSLMSQLSSAYGGQTHNEQIGRGPAGFTQGFADFFTGEGYYADPRPTFGDAPWSISETPIDVGTRGGGVLNPYGYAGSFTGNLEEFNPINKPTSQPGRPHSGITRPSVYPNQTLGVEDYGATKPQINPMQQQVQPQIGAGLTGLAAYQSQNKGMV